MELNISKENNIHIEEISLKHNLDLVVLFGSYAKGRAVKESDIDIGVFKKNVLLYQDELLLSKDFSDIFKSNNVNLSVISSNNPLLMYNILKFGKVLYTKESNTAYILKLYAWKLLAESKTYRDHIFAVLKQKIALL